MYYVDLDMTAPLSLASKFNPVATRNIADKNFVNSTVKDISVKHLGLKIRSITTHYIMIVFHSVR